MRDLIILNHRGLHGSLVHELRQLGIEIISENLDPTDVMLDRTLACIFWFYEGMRSPLQTWRLSRRLRGRGVPLVAWNQDAPHYLNRAAWRLDCYDRARLLDMYATHTLIDKQRCFADTVLYLPNAADVERYGLGGDASAVLKRLRDPGQYQYDVSFFGAMDGGRYKEMRPRQEFFATLSRRLTDSGIRHVFREAKGMAVADQVGLIQSSRINLNFGASCDYGATVASGLPERCFGIPAAGGFLLCDRRTHAGDHFVTGTDWADYDGMEDCVSKISYWLRHFDAARDIAENAYRRVVRDHTYRHRAATLYRALSDWHAGMRGSMR